MNYRLGIKRLLRKIGYDINRYPSFPLRSRIQLINKLNIDTILDIGANIGQYAQEMRNLGYDGQIISFEPVNQAYNELLEHAKTDPKWICQNLAFGDFDGYDEINISGRHTSSSLLHMNEVMENIIPDVKYVSKQKVQVMKLSSYIRQARFNNLFIKIDTQGYEMKILEGAALETSNIKAIQLEMSFEEIYRGEVLIHDMVQYLYSNGYKLWNLEPGFYDPQTLRLLQADGVFVKKDLLI